MFNHIKQADGALDLSGRKFVMMGAGAELAPTELLLEAGATVLWIGRNPPPAELLKKGSSGTLVYSESGADLLTQPREIAATIAEFASGDPVDIGMFAYARGDNQDWRLTTAMNDIVRSLEPEIIQSLSYYISPTVPMVPQPEDIRRATDALEQPAKWQAILAQIGLLQTNHYDGLVRAIVLEQKAAYLGAQYIGKILSAEVFATLGNRPEIETPHPLTVSANVAGISHTLSLITPIFEAGFLGGEVLNVETYPADTSKPLQFLLTLHDLINPQAPGSATRSYQTLSAKLNALFSQQVHGGVYSYPYALNGVISIAALLGFGIKPSLLLDLAEDYLDKKHRKKEAMWLRRIRKLWSN